MVPLARCTVSYLVKVQTSSAEDLLCLTLQAASFILVGRGAHLSYLAVAETETEPVESVLRPCAFEKIW